MFSTHNYSNNRHGATSGSTSATFQGSFSGTEGPEAANKLCSTIKIKLGQINALQFLTTPLQEIVSQIPPPETKSAKLEVYKMEQKLLEHWNRAYWTVREFFLAGSPAGEQMKLFDDTADLPELWRTFNVHYVAAANFSGLFSLFDQLYGPSFVQKNLLAEFVRQNDLQRRIMDLKDQPHVNFMQTPQKALFQSPFSRRTLDLRETPLEEDPSDDSAEGGAATPKERTFLTTTTESIIPQTYESRDEWRRVMSTLFTMRNQKEHGPTILRFIRDTLLRDETERSAFSLTEQKIYSSLRTYLEF